MCFDSGMYFIDGGFRPAITKTGYKWTFVIFIDGTRIRCKRMLSSKVGRARPIGGNKPYSTAELAGQFLIRKTLTGQRYRIAKRTRTMLQAARS
jgi:hypothetical protein